MFSFLKWARARLVQDPGGRFALRLVIFLLVAAQAWRILDLLEIFPRAAADALHDGLWYWSVASAVVGPLVVLLAEVRGGSFTAYAVSGPVLLWPSFFLDVNNGPAVFLPIVFGIGVLLWAMLRAGQPAGERLPPAPWARKLLWLGLLVLLMQVATVIMQPHLVGLLPWFVRNAISETGFVFACGGPIALLLLLAESFRQRSLLAYLCLGAFAAVWPGGAAVTVLLLVPVSEFGVTSKQPLLALLVLAGAVGGALLWLLLWWRRPRDIPPLVGFRGETEGQG